MSNKSEQVQRKLDQKMQEAQELRRDIQEAIGGTIADLNATLPSKFNFPQPYCAESIAGETVYVGVRTYLRQQGTQLTDSQIESLTEHAFFMLHGANAHLHDQDSFRKWLATELESDSE